MDSLNNGPKFGGDAWLELQAFKTRQINRREKLNRHKDLINGISSSQSNQQLSNAALASSSHSGTINPTNSSVCDLNNLASPNSLIVDQSLKSDELDCGYHDKDSIYSSNLIESICKNLHNTINSDNRVDELTTRDDRLVDIGTIECLLLLKLCDVALKLPIDSKSLQKAICKVRGFERTSQATVENLLEKFAHQELITIEEPSSAILSKRREQDDDICIYVIYADHTKLVELERAFGSSDNLRALLLDSSRIEAEEDGTSKQSSNDISNHSGIIKTHKLTTKLSSNTSSKRHHSSSEDVESLLSLSSTRERESKKLGEELLELLSKPTAKERNLLESFQSADGYQVQEFCPKGTKDECRRNGNGTQACDKLHFKKIIAKHTEESLGDCSFLNTCFHMDSCKYVHYEVDYDGKQRPQSQIVNISLVRQQQRNSGFISSPSGQVEDTATTSKVNELMQDDKNIIQHMGITSGANSLTKCTLTAEEKARIELRNRKRFKTVLYPPQWIQCDLRYFDMSLLGKFSVVMADPPWDIHMELPYGTMSDEEMRKLNVPALQDDGVIFLWVTGRAMELGRECLALWGYERCDEIIWVKTNQLQRIIRTGRTGHWLNHGKEHCLVGIKGNPTDMNRGLDCDIIVAEVRATSHKPDEIYGIIERLSPGTRKIELFGRSHNVQPNWITLGNQLDGVRLVEPNLIDAFEKHNLPYQTNDHASS